MALIEVSSIATRYVVILVIMPRWFLKDHEMLIPTICTLKLYGMVANPLYGMAKAGNNYCLYVGRVVENVYVSITEQRLLGGVLAIREITKIGNPSLGKAHLVCADIQHSIAYRSRDVLENRRKVDNRTRMVLSITRNPTELANKEPFQQEGNSVVSTSSISPFV